ncbi:hypothetical protein ACHAWF_003083 [Thalassiosira exigua]
MSSASVARSQPPRPVIFLDIDGVLNTTKHNAQIHFEPRLLKRLKGIVEMTDALIVLSTFWRHFHEYITYVLHRHGIDVGRHMLPLPMGATRGKQCTKKFLHFHRIKQKEHGHSTLDNDENSSSMIGRSADDEGEYASRGEEIEAWLKTYGDQYLGDCKVDDSNTDDVTMSGNEEYAFHRSDWRYAILDDRPTAAKPDTPLFERFIFVDTKVGLTKEDAETAIKLLRFGT